MKISLNKYLVSAVGLLIAFICFGIILLALWISEDVGLKFYLLVALVCLGLLIPSVYDFCLYFKLKRKSVDVILREAVVYNWEAVGKYGGRVIIMIDDREMHTAAHFNRHECKEMVGKTVSYAIIDGILMIDSIKESLNETDLYTGE